MVRKLLLASGASLMALASVFPALAASPTSGNSNGSVGATSVAPGGSTTFTATFKDNNGSGVAGASVTFSQQSGPNGCTATFSPSSGTTNSSGTVTTTVTLPAGCSGSYVLAASTQGATVTSTVAESGGFPATSTEGPSSGTPVWAFAGLALGFVLIVASGLGLTRIRRS